MLVWGHEEEYCYLANFYGYLGIWPDAYLHPHRI